MLSQVDIREASSPDQPDEPIVAQLLSKGNQSYQSPALLPFFSIVL